jgi:hypothetical protein
MKRSPPISSRKSFNRRAPNRNTTIRFILLSAAGLIGQGIAHATDISWNRAAGNTGNISDGTNWVGGVAPGSSDNGFINNGGIASSSSPYVGTISNLRLGFGQTDSGTLVMSPGGALEVGGGFVGDLSIGGDGAGTLIINGGNLITRFLYLGQRSNGHGIGTQTDGTFEVKRNFVMAELKPASAVIPTASNYTMSGGTLLIGTIGGGELYIGAHGPSTFTLSGNSLVSVNTTIHIGASAEANDPPRGVGTLNMSGGAMNVTSGNAHFVIGDGGDGTMNLSGGSITTKFYNTGQNPGALGWVNQTGGSVTALGAFVVGEASQLANLYDLSGGSVAVTGGDMNLGSGAGVGTLKVRGTGSLSISGTAHLGAGPTSSGTLNLSAGSIMLGADNAGTASCIVGDSGTGVLIVSGGLLNTPFMTLGQNAGALGTGTQTGGMVSIANNLSIGEASTNNNMYAISAGTLQANSGIYVGTSGNGIFNVSGTASVAAAELHNVETGTGTISISGGSINVGLTTNNGMFTQSAGTASLGPVSGAGQINVSGGTLTAASIAQGTLALSGTGRVNVTPGGVTNTLTALTLTGTSKLDLANNHLILDYPTIGPSPLASLKAALIAGSITSSTAAAIAANPANTHKTALGYAEANQVHDFVANPNFTFGGQPVDSTAVLIRYTYTGDANLDGAVSTPDFTALASNFNGVGKAWFNGDFNFDGKVNALDFNALATNFGQPPLSSPSLGTLVPEPASIGLVVLGSFCAARRRRSLV